MKRKSLLLVLLLALLLPASILRGQGLEYYGFGTGTGATWYSPTWTEIIASGKDDAASSLQSIGFDFVYDGTTYNQFSANSNGNVRLGSTVISSSGYSTPFGSSNYSTNEPKIIGIGTDLSTGADGYVRTGLSGSSGSYVRVIEFKLHTGSSSSGTNYVNFQVQLFQANKMVKIVYNSSSNNPSSYQIGLGNASSNKFWYVNPTNHTATYSTTYTGNTYSTYPNQSSSNLYYWFAPPHFTSTTTTYYISNFTTTGGNSNINNTTSGTGASWSNYYDSYAASYYAGSTVNFTITINGGGTHGSAIWVDWNQNNMFESDERVYHTSSYASSPHTGSFTIPTSTAAGDYRMRIVSDYYGSNPNNPYEGNTGEFEDYKLTVTVPTSTDLPTYVRDKYSLTQQIYTSAEIADFAGTSLSGNITSIQFYSGSNAETRNLTIYMQNTTKSSFSSGSDWVTSDHNLVYEGNVTFAENSWVTIELDEPFLYDASQNLLLVVDDNTGSYATGTRTFYTYPTGADRAIYIHSDGTNYSPTSSYNGTLLQQNSQFKLTIVPLPATLPYTENFDNDAHGFMFVNGSYPNQWTVGTGTHSSGSQALYIANSGSYSYNNGSVSYVYAYREINFAEAGDYNVTFKWKGRGESGCWDAMCAALCPPSGTFPPSSNVTGSTNSVPSGYTNVGDVSQSYNTTGAFLWTYNESDWRTSSKSFNISSPGIYKLVFYWKNDSGSGSQPPAAVDDLVVKRAYPLTLAANPSGSGTISATYNNTSVSSGTAFVPATVINVTATPAAGYVFDSWTVSGTDASVANANVPTTTLTTGSEATTLTANFIPWTISVATNPSSTECLTSGTEVTMTASTNITLGLENYIFTTGTGGSTYSPSWTNMIASGNDDLASSLFDIGFDFVYDGVTYNQFSANSNGNLRLGSEVIATSGYTSPFGSSYYSTNEPKIVGIGRDMSTGAEGYVKTGLYGSEGSYVRVTEFMLNTGASSSGTTYVIFQVQLFQATGEVRIVYTSDYSNAPSGYQVGIGNATYNKFWHVNPSSHTATYSTTYNTSTYSVWPGGGRYYSFKPLAAAPTYAWTYSGTSGSANNNVYTASPTTNSTYTVSVTYNGATKSESVNVTVIPAAPTGLSVSNLTANSAVVSWSPNGESSWEYSIDNGTNWVSTLTPSAELSNLNMATTYTFLVKTISGDCESPEASIGFVTPYPTFSKTIAPYEGNGGYYLIASPLAAAVDPTDVGNMITDNLGNTATTSTSTYDLYSFDQSQTLEWQNYRNEAFNLVNGQGYLYASKGGTRLTVTGAPGTNGEVTLHVTDSTTGLEFSKWNLVGNPFGVDAYLPRTRAFYTMQNSDHFTPATAGTSIGVMEAVFVIAETDGEMLTFLTTAPSKVSQLNLNLTKGASTGSATLMDRAIVRFDEGSQLPKMQFRKGSTKVYIPQEGKDYAVVSSESMGTMPVNFKAESNGTYTLSVNAEEVSFAYLHLIDNMTGNDVDLLANPSYSFEARTTDYESRFKLVFATGNNSNDDNFAFYSNGSFVINNEGEATLQVIDMNGRILKSESINGCANVNVKAAAGVYVLRLVNGNDIKVQKVVVR